jgi:Tfp pilus assembly protein PilN
LNTSVREPSLLICLLSHIHLVAVVVMLAECVLILRRASKIPSCDGAPLTHLFIVVTGQLQEMEMIRQKVYQLEQAQIKMKQEYASPALLY